MAPSLASWPAQAAAGSSSSLQGIPVSERGPLSEFYGKSERSIKAHQFQVVRHGTSRRLDRSPADLVEFLDDLWAHHERF
jgi:hypothetical protein